MIDAETDRLTHLVSNLLDMSRLQTGALKVRSRPTALEDVLYAAIGSLGSGAARVIIDVPDRTPRIDTDAGLLERAIANVVDNAIDWSPEADVVRVEAAVVADHVDVRVIDRGPGIPEGQREQVFEPFQRLGDARARGRMVSVSGWLSRVGSYTRGWGARDRRHAGRRHHDRRLQSAVGCDVEQHAWLLVCDDRRMHCRQLVGALRHGQFGTKTAEDPPRRAACVRGTFAAVTVTDLSGVELLVRARPA